MSPTKRPTAPAAAAVGAAAFGASPLAVTLPGAGHPADVVPMGVQLDGQMDIPPDPQTVGWWTGGAVPGDGSGAVVLVGHIDSATQGLGVFALPPSLSAGQRITVTDTDELRSPTRCRAAARSLRPSCGPSC